MTPETEVISCPACKHALRVPADWLGQTVQCPECQAKFQAPIREDGRLTAPILLSAPAPVNPVPVRGRADWMLTLPAFGLMLIGVVATITDGVLAFQFASSPDGGKGALIDRMPELRRMGLVAPDPNLDQQTQDEQAAAQAAATLMWVLPLGTMAGALTFAGGLAMVLRRWHRLAQIGCVLAAVNLPNFFCVPGALFGLWGLLLLSSEEGREHFTA
jgi:hypothetical protein